MLSGLNTHLGRITMYRLVFIMLLVLAAFAVALSFAGLLAFSPGELGASLAAAVVSSWVGTRLMALVFRTRPHTESSLITGLLLFFVMFPSSEPAGLAAIGAAGLIASASKYLVAIRGRHVFNPAAFGAVVVTLTGLGAAAWWPANPAMLPLVLLFTALLLHRNQKLSMGVLFIAVAAGILTVRLAAGGMPVLDALALVFQSYPLLFLVGFMLTEPLTLPPRRWQQLLVAAVVAIVLALQISIPPVFLGPEFALVIGNALAFSMGQRRGIKLRFTGARNLTPTSTELLFTPEHPVRFQPGQYMELTLPHERADIRGVRRVFSISSAPGDKIVSFGLRLSEPLSSFKTALVALKPGTSVSATSVGGDFVLPPGGSVPLFLFAGGIGVTPFVSQLRAGAAEGGRDVVMAYVVSSPAELAYVEELSTVRVLLFCPSMPSITLPAQWQYMGTEFPTADQLREAVPDIAARRIQVSGSPSMLARARQVIRSAGGKSVHTDAFLGY
ncbi:FAD-dependent oxidoreductase [Arthrobacter sp. H5]|uniref:FAD-dependent oxidoreductase n=1 Tax=Arthrobacter sp. H5 TaxID=1267973 RepID=UPI000483AE64|nr:FAD-dependent oxidoreductase [Arthrobacter sp. H5]